MRSRTTCCALFALSILSVQLRATDVDVSILGTTAPLATFEITEEVALGSTMIVPTSILAVDVTATPGVDHTVYVSRDGGVVHGFYYVDLIGEPTAGLLSMTSDVFSTPSGPVFSPVSFDVLFEVPPSSGCPFCPTSYIIADPEITSPLGCPHVVMCSTFAPDSGVGGETIEGWGVGATTGFSLLGEGEGVGFRGNDGTLDRPTAVARFDVTIPPLGSRETSAEYVIMPEPTAILTWVEDPDFGLPIIPDQIEGAGAGEMGGLTVHVIEGFVGSGDCNGDVDVDLVDFADFTLCFTGAAGQFASPSCACADFDGDRDVDLGDFAQFQLQFTGAAVIN